MIQKINYYFVNSFRQRRIIEKLVPNLFDDSISDHKNCLKFLKEISDSDRYDELYDEMKDKEMEGITRIKIKKGDIVRKVHTNVIDPREANKIHMVITDVITLPSGEEVVWLDNHVGSYGCSSLEIVPRYELVRLYDMLKSFQR